jgi:hypothetical protein
MPIDFASTSFKASAHPGSGIGPVPELLTGLRSAHPGPERTFHEQLRMLRSASFISFARVQDSVSIWIADNRGMQFLIAERGFRDVAGMCEELLALARTPRSEPQAIAKLGVALFRVLFDPIRHQLDSKRLLYVHCGPGLDHLPLSLLRVEEDCLLSERYRTSIAADFPSRERFEAAGKLSADAPFLFLDAGAAPARFSDAPLAGPVDEDFLRLRFCSLVALTGSSATWEAFENLAASAQGIHCRVAITDGVHGPQLPLAAAEGATNPGQDAAPGYLPLAALRRKALAECRLGVFDAKWLPNRADEMHLLWQRCRGALHHAGIANVLLPRWEVDSAVTYCFLGRFYTRLVAGTAIDAAFRDAVASIRCTKGWEHPNYWAGFAHSVSHL